MTKKPPNEQCQYYGIDCLIWLTHTHRASSSNVVLRRMLASQSQCDHWPKRRTIDNRPVALLTNQVIDARERLIAKNMRSFNSMVPVPSWAIEKPFDWFSQVNPLEGISSRISVGFLKCARKLVGVLNATQSIGYSKCRARTLAPMLVENIFAIFESSLSDRNNQSIRMGGMTTTDAPRLLCEHHRIVWLAISRYVSEC